MTLIIAAEGKDFVVVGADSLGTYGGTSGTNVSVDSNKYFEITKHVVILLAGDGEVGHQLIEEFKQTIGSIDGITNIANRFVKFCRVAFEHLKNFPIPDLENMFPGCAFIIAGLDKQNSDYKIPKTYITYSTDNFMLRSDDLRYEIGGKTMIARYLFNKNYDNDKDTDANYIASLVRGVLYDVGEEANDGEVDGEKIILAKIDSEGIIIFNEQQKEEFKIQWIENTTFNRTPSE